MIILVISNHELFVQFFRGVKGLTVFNQLNSIVMRQGYTQSLLILIKLFQPGLKAPKK